MHRYSLHTTRVATIYYTLMTIAAFTAISVYTLRCQRSRSGLSFRKDSHDFDLDATFPF